MYDYNYLNFILRAQPFHNGHAKVIEHALSSSEHVNLLVGSANRPRSWYNPFTFEERASIIDDWFPQNYKKRVTILPLNDHLYDESAWEEEVQHLVAGAVSRGGWRDRTKIGLIGHSKDHTGYYLKKFPQWGEHVHVAPYFEREVLSATQVRNIYFERHALELPSFGILGAMCPHSTVSFLKKFHATNEWLSVFDEHNFCLQYQEDHKFAKPKSYNAKHLTADAVVIQSGHILLIRRGTHPGMGLRALPGGFVGDFETSEEAMLRELKEETRIKIPPNQLRNSIKDRYFFDDVYRSGRGRVCTNAFLIQLEPALELPKIKAASDAKKDSAEWVPFADLDPREFFEDHYFIAKRMLRSIK